MVHCVESIQIRSFSGPYFPVFGPEKTPYLDSFHAVVDYYHQNLNGLVASRVVEQLGILGNEDIL